MGEVLLVAGGDHDRRAVARPDVGEGEQDVDLAAVPPLIEEVVQRSQRVLAGARVHCHEAAGPPQHGRGRVEAQTLEVVAVLLAAVTPHALDPGRMIDQPLERLARLDDWSRTTRPRRCPTRAGSSPTTRAGPGREAPSPTPR